MLWWPEPQLSLRTPIHILIPKTLKVSLFFIIWFFSQFPTWHSNVSTNILILNLKNKSYFFFFLAVWAARAFQQAEVHMKLLKAVGPTRMKFSKMDDEIYDSFRKEFPDFNIKKIDEDLMKVCQKVLMLFGCFFSLKIKQNVIKPNFFRELMKEKSNGANGVTNTKKLSKITISEPCSVLTPTRITLKKTRSFASASNS